MKIILPELDLEGINMELKKLPKIALGAWAWGNDGTFGGSLSADDLRPVFEAGMKAGLN